MSENAVETKEEQRRKEWGIFHKTMASAEKEFDAATSSAERAYRKVHDPAWDIFARKRDDAQMIIDARIKAIDAQGDTL